MAENFETSMAEVLQVMRGVTDENRQRNWGLALMLAWSAGFLSRHTREKIDLNDPTNMAMVQTRDTVRDELERLISEQPDLDELAVLRRGITALKSRYKEAVLAFPGLQ